MSKKVSVALEVPLSVVPQHADLCSRAGPQIVGRFKVMYGQNYLYFLGAPSYPICLTFGLQSRWWDRTSL